VSKAAVAAMVGADAALSTERGYLTAVVPRAVARELGAALRGRPAGLAGAAALAVAVGAAGSGYLRGRLDRHSAGGRSVRAGDRGGAGSRGDDRAERGQA
jgi:hypothetical protein